MAKQAVKSSGGGSAAAMGGLVSDDAYGDLDLMSAIAMDVMPLPPVTEVPPHEATDGELAAAAAQAEPDPLAPEFIEYPIVEDTSAAAGEEQPKAPKESLWRSFAMPGASKEAPWLLGQGQFEEDYKQQLEQRALARAANRRRLIALAAVLLGIVLLAGYWTLTSKNQTGLTEKELANLDSTRGKLIILDGASSDTGAIKATPKPAEVVEKPKTKDFDAQALIQNIVAPSPVAPPPPVANTTPPLAPMTSGPMPVLVDAPSPLPPPPGFKTPQLARLSDVSTGPLPPPVTGAPAWTTNGRHFDGSPSIPRVALIISGLGLDRAVTEAVITRLPVEVSLAFSPYAQDLDAQIASARAHGHEVFLDMPMEPVDFPASDAGPLALKASGSVEDNANRLKILLSKAGGCAGFLGEEGGKALQSSAVMQPVAREMANRGLLWVQPPKSPVAVSNVGGPVVVATVAVDQLEFGLSTETRLEYLAKVARHQGMALGVAKPTPGSLTVIIRWLDSLKAAGVVLAPATATVLTPAASLATTPPAKAG